MIFIVVKFTARPEHVDTWVEKVSSYTESTRSEPGNVFFEWSRSIDNPSQYLLVEAFRDDDAAVAHVQSEHFTSGCALLSTLVATVPEIINTPVDGDGWSTMSEVTPTDA